MLLLKPIIVCIIAMLLVMILKSSSSEFVPIVLFSSGIIVLIYIYPYISTLLNLISGLGNKAYNVFPIMKTTVKIVIIAIICEFSAQLCEDSGQGYLSSKINFAGKIVILSVITPMILRFIEYIIELSNKI